MTTSAIADSDGGQSLVVVFDTETTGLPLHPKALLSKQPRIIELGAALMNFDGEIVGTFQQLLNPGELITDEITRITGITNDQLRDQPRFVDVLPELRLFFGRAFAVFAHNLPFDRSLLNFDLERAGCKDFPWPPMEFCTVGLHRAEWGRNPKLTELYEFAMERPLPQTHRALDDVLALAEVVRTLELHSMAYEQRGLSFHQTNQTAS
jgi:DNA polymerase III epsilon subunit-like protein